MAETYNDYPQGATNNAKRALKYKDENPDNKCGTPVGWARANQLAKREKISRETIARMASFKRHQKSKDVPYSEGCGGLMWDAWGGSSGVKWAISKLKKIDKAAQSMSRQFAFGVESNKETQVNNEDGTMRSVALISVGSALGHGLYVDGKSLETIIDELEDTKLPAYITHRGALFEDRLTREIGMFNNFRIEGDRLLGDFQAFDSFREDDSRKYNRLFEMAEKMPERFGLSIVFEADIAWATPDGDVPMGRFPNNDSDRLYDEDNPPEDALFEYPSIRVEEVSSADFVDSPAANQRGLFSIIDTKPNYKMTKAELTELNEKLKQENETLALSVTDSEARVEELQFKLKESSAPLAEDDEEAEVEEAAEELVEEDEVVEEDAEVVEDEEAEVEEDEAEVEEEEVVEEDEVEELKKEIASKLEEIAGLNSKLEEMEKEMGEDQEKMEAKASKLSSKVATLEKLIEGSDLVQASVGDKDYEPSKANRSKIISEFAKENKISEFAATLRLGKDRPELFQI